MVELAGSHASEEASHSVHSGCGSSASPKSLSLLAELMVLSTGLRACRSVPATLDIDVPKSPCDLGHTCSLFHDWLVHSFPSPQVSSSD